MEFHFPALLSMTVSASALQEFRARAVRSARVEKTVLEDSDCALLANLQLEEGQYLKRATVLLFGKQPERFVLGASIKIGFFITDDDLRYQDEIQGNLFTQVEKALELLHSKYLKAHIRYDGIQRVERYPFPLHALREALLNAVIHKDYSSGIPIQISVYEHQIVIWNTGQLPDQWTHKQLLSKHPSHPFNPLLASVFFRAGYIESWGRGIEKILSECRKHGIPGPLFDTSLSGLMITFQTTQETTQEIGAGPVSGRILSLLRQQPMLTRRELAKHLNIGADGVKYHLSKLRAAGMIRHVGSTKSGRWEVLK